MVQMASTGLGGTVCKGTSVSVCVCQVVLNLHLLAHTAQAEDCVWPGGCQRPAWGCAFTQDSIWWS